MRLLLSLALAAAVLAAWPAAAQQKDRGARGQKQGMQPTHEQGRDMRRERFSREERDKLRQDLIDANREMKGKK